LPPMETSILLGKLIGPILLIFSVGLLANRSLIRPIADEILASPTWNYTFGFFDLLTGLALVLFHNVWVWHWPLIITLFAWNAILRGVLHLLFPRLSLGRSSKFISSDGVLVTALVVAGLAGLALTYFAYTA